MDAHLADVKFVALQHRSGAKESQATLYYAPNYPVSFVLVNNNK
jgi:hypothetical protein